MPASLKLITSSVMLPNRKVTSKVPEEKHGKTENDGALKINSVNDEKEVGGGGGRRERYNMNAN